MCCAARSITSTPLLQRVLVISRVEHKLASHQGQEENQSPSLERHPIKSHGLLLLRFSAFLLCFSLGHIIPLSPMHLRSALWILDMKAGKGIDDSLILNQNPALSISFPSTTPRPLEDGYAVGNGTSWVRQGSSTPVLSQIRSTVSSAIRRHVISLPPVMVIKPATPSSSS